MHAVVGASLASVRKRHRILHDERFEIIAGKVGESQCKGTLLPSRSSRKQRSRKAQAERGCPHLVILSMISHDSSCLVHSCAPPIWSGIDLDGSLAPVWWFTADPDRVNWVSVCRGEIKPATSLAEPEAPKLLNFAIQLSEAREEIANGLQGLQRRCSSRRGHWRGRAAE